MIEKSTTDTDAPRSFPTEFISSAGYKTGKWHTPLGGGSECRDGLRPTTILKTITLR
jgi:hypothetical protein